MNINNKTISPMDIAKMLGIENEYNEELMKREINECYDDFIGSSFIDLDFNIDDDSNDA